MEESIFESTHNDIIGTEIDTMIYLKVIFTVFAAEIFGTGSNCNNSHIRSQTTQRLNPQLYGKGLFQNRIFDRTYGSIGYIRTFGVDTIAINAVSVLFPPN